MHVVNLPPDATNLLESMRAVGYSFETAAADIMDNCITAGASFIDVSFSAYGNPFVTFLDNGAGMDADELRIAMRHGSRSAQLERASTDLGRFGLGLKTGSLSQCRRLTVATLKKGKLSGARWDLDKIEEVNEWALLEFEEIDFDEIPGIESLRNLRHGTLVVWQQLDRVFEGESQKDRALQNKIDDTRDHVALIYHRFLEGEVSPLEIRINNLVVDPIDPFLRKRKGVQTLPPEPLTINGHNVGVQAYILPHISKLTAADVKKAGGNEGLRKNQGFYVYRNFRLIIWGTWFRLARQEEMSKLARVIVDIPNSLDHLWKLDLKKSTAYPPEEVRQGLGRIVERIADRSKKVYTFRGRKSTSPDSIHAWERVEYRDGRIGYKINREHDLVSSLRTVLPETNGRLLEQFLGSLEQLFPFDALYADMAAERRITDDENNEEMERNLTEMAQLMLDALGRNSKEAKQLLSRLHILDPFAKHKEITTRIMEKLT